MDKFWIGHAADDHWVAAADSCLAQLGATSARANLGFLYVADAWAPELPEILAYFKAHTLIEHWVGTLGVGVCATAREYFDTPAMAVLAGEFPEDGYRVFGGSPVGSIEDGSIGGGSMAGSLGDSVAIFPGGSSVELDDVAAEQAWRAREDARFAVVHADPTNSRTPALIAQLASQLDDGFLVGGITSSRHSHLQIANGVIQGGISGVIFSSSIPVATGLTQGCSPIGPVHEITRCQRNIAVQIDGRPALEVFYEDIGDILARDLTKVAGYIFAGLPIRGSDTGDYLVRNLLGVDTNNQLLAVGEVLQPGSSILFCKRDAQSAQIDLQRMLSQLQRRARGRPKAGLYFSCLGRGNSLFGQDRELEIIREELGDFPLVGFFANGEISHNRLYGYTGVLSLFL